MNIKTFAALIGIGALAATATALLTNTPETKSAIRTALQSAASDVSGGAAINEALREQLQNENVTRKQWNIEARRINDTNSRHTFWFAAKKLPPTVIGQRLLGDCEQGECSVKPDVAKARAAKWRYEIRGTVGDWKVGRVHAAPYFAAGLKAWANANADAIWLGGAKQAKAKCLAKATAAQCRSLLSHASDCWALFDAGGELERMCRHGITRMLPGTHPDLGAACDPTDGQDWRPINCVTRKPPQAALDEARVEVDLTE
jgi:hypothetical protein